MKTYLLDSNPLSIARRLRFLFAFSNMIMSILCPLIVYKQTGKLSATALLVISEWFPKLLIYLYSGDLIKRLGMAVLHYGLEFIRMAGLIILFLSVLNLLPWWTLIVASLTFHSVLAITNVGYEIHMKQWSANAALGHASFIQTDLIAGGLGMILCLLTNDSQFIVFMLIGLNVVTLLMLRSQSAYIYHIKKSSDHPIKLNSPLVSLGQFSKELWGMTLIGLSCAIPIGALLGALPFFLEYGLGSKMDLNTISAFSLARMLGGAFVMYLAMTYLVKRSAYSLFIVGIVINFASLVALSVMTGPAYGVCWVLFLVSCGLLYPWHRESRQGWMKKTGAEHLTGMFIAFQAMGSLFSAALMYFVGDERYILIILSIIYVCLLTAGFLLVKRALLTPPSMSGTDPVASP